MSVSVQTVEHIARLARLEFAEAELAAFTEQFNKILAYIEKLNELDTNDVEPLAQVTETTNVLREDEPAPCIPVESALLNAPARLENFLKVPKVVE